MMQKSRAAIGIASLMLLALAQSGCAKRGETETSTTVASSQLPTAQPIAAESAAAAPAPAQSAAPAVAGASAQPPAASSAAAPAGPSSDGDVAGTKFTVNSLQRGGDVVTLKFTIINDSPKAIDTFGRFNGPSFNGYRDMSGVTLIDTVAKKKYFALADSEKVCVCSHDVANIEPGTQTPVWVKFPQLPPGVTKITVVVPHFIPLDGVPIT